MRIKEPLPQFALHNVPDPSSELCRTSVYNKILGCGVVFWVYLGVFCVSVFNFYLFWFLLMPRVILLSSLSLLSCFGKYYIAFFAINLIEIYSK